jgi:TatD DNase family protein
MLGEIGLDHRFVEDASQYPAQRLVFEFFLTAAKGQDKIVNLHTSGAERETLRLLARYGIHRAIVHWYSGPLDILREVISQGLYFTVGVGVLHSDHIRAIAREIPAAQLLTETDNPVGEKWLTGIPGMPHLIEDVIQALAELRGTTAEAIAQTVQVNFARLIRNDPWVSGANAKFFAGQPDHT